LRQFDRTAEGGKIHFEELKQMFVRPRRNATAPMETWRHSVSRIRRREEKRM
jgi:hypothetical protein